LDCPSKSVFLDCGEDLIVCDSDLHLDLETVGRLGRAFFVVSKGGRFGDFGLLMELVLLEVL
jgi:hypothetical protein